MAFTCEEARELLSAIADHANEWAGLPIPFEDDDGLVVHPSYPWAHVFMKDNEDPQEDVELVNQWYSPRLRCDIVLWREGGKLNHAALPAMQHAGLILKTLGAVGAWSVEAEVRALQKLASHVTEHAYTCYLLTGTFLETSPRSGVTYLFRKLRPTLAMRPDGDNQMRILAALCMHPIAYYSGSWAGAMVPTDDVLSHLLLMRADEKLLWRRCNQHGAQRPEAGI